MSVNILQNIQLISETHVDSCSVFSNVLSYSFEELMGKRRTESGNWALERAPGSRRWVFVTLPSPLNPGRY